MKAALFVVLAAAVVVALVAAAQRASENSANEQQAARAAAAAADEARRRAYEADVRREQLERIARTQFKATRAPAGDERCKGSRQPPNAYIFGGSTHADNVIAGATLGCEPLGGASVRSSLFFCCSRSDLPAVPQIQLP